LERQSSNFGGEGKVMSDVSDQKRGRLWEPKENKMGRKTKGENTRMGSKKRGGGGKEDMPLLAKG